MKYQEAYQKYGTVRKAAEALGIPKSTFFDYLQREVNGMDDLDALRIATEPFKQTLSVSDESPTSIEDLLLANNIDLDRYEVVNAGHNKLASGKYTTRVNIRPKTLCVSDLVQSAIENLNAKPRHVIPKENYNSEQNNLLAEFCAFDLHLSKLAHHEETNEDYDINIAARRFKSAVDQAVARCKEMPIKRFLHIIGNDYFHFDNLDQTTTKGTMQDADTRLHKMFTMGIELAIYAIDQFLSIADVDVLLVKGNHDLTTSYYLSVVLDAYYKDQPRVSIDTSPQTRKYYRHENVMLGFSHGNDQALKDLGMTMATEAPDMWAKSVYREIHLGHLHKRKQLSYINLDSEKGLVVRHLPSLSGTDSWHSQKGYVGGVRAADLYLWEPDGLHSQHGLRAK